VHIGDTVKITGGPFAGRRARLAGTAGQRVSVVVELQGRQLDVEMDPDWIVPVGPERRSASSIEAPGTHKRSSA